MYRRKRKEQEEDAKGERICEHVLSFPLHIPSLFFSLLHPVSLEASWIERDRKMKEKEESCLMLLPPISTPFFFSSLLVSHGGMFRGKDGGAGQELMERL